jgi:hypothetical protein
MEAFWVVLHRALDDLMNGVNPSSTIPYCCCSCCASYPARVLLEKVVEKVVERVVESVMESAMDNAMYRVTLLDKPSQCLHYFKGESLPS